jgi:hypothetical protein
MVLFMGDCWQPVSEASVEFEFFLPQVRDRQRGCDRLPDKAALMVQAALSGPALNDYIRSDGRDGSRRWRRRRPANLPTRRVFFTSRRNSVRTVIESLRWLSGHRGTPSPLSHPRTC